MSFARIKWLKKIRASAHLLSTIEALMAEIKERKKIDQNIVARRLQKCKHVWICLKGRCHNKGDGKGKYRVYKCQKCFKSQKRYKRNKRK